MVDSVGLGSLLTSALNWLEARKQRKLLEEMATTQAKTMRRSSRRRRRAKPKASPAAEAAKAAVEERRRLQLQLEREKHEWRKNRDIAKGISWILGQINKNDDDDEDED